MVKSELISRSPLRIFEKSIHGWLKPGQIGVLASKKGVGKTACLVHIATDKLLNGKHIIHASFSPRVDHIVEWYEDIFTEIAKKRNLENAHDIHDEIIRNRVIMNFSQKGTTVAKVLKSIDAMISDGHFSADTVVFDGLDFSGITSEDLGQIKNFANEKKLTLWFSVTLQGDEPFDNDGYPFGIGALDTWMDVIITLRYEGSHIKLSLIKEHDSRPLQDMHLILDSKTMLIAEE